MNADNPMRIGTIEVAITDLVITKIFAIRDTLRKISAKFANNWETNNFTKERDIVSLLFINLHEINRSLDRIELVSHHHNGESPPQGLVEDVVGSLKFDEHSLCPDWL